MRRMVIVTTAVALIATGAVTGLANGRIKVIRERLNGVKEVPVISTTGKGVFTAKISQDESQISYELSYDSLEAAVTQAHIHIGPPQNTGQISVWLCSNLTGSAAANVPPGTQACPADGGTITGLITADDVVGPAAQGILAGEFGELLALIRAGKTYVNVHSVTFPAGEIRSQISRDDHDHNSHGRDKH